MSHCLPFPLARIYLNSLNPLSNLKACIQFLIILSLRMMTQILYSLDI